MEDFVKTAWEDLCARYTSDQALITKLWDELEQAYTSKSRHYHNLEHLAFMLQLAEEYGHENRQNDLLPFAIFYHDVVYNPSRSDNEKKSAELAAKRLTALGLPAADIAYVEEMIQATKTHQKHTDALINFLLDLDLAILGADSQRYEAYRQAVRKEYSLYPDMLYKSGRKRVLQHFLDQPAIYKTPLFQQQFEEQARLNLQRELTSYT